MLTYLDSLCDAMVARDLSRLRHLIDDHPLVRLLPKEALAEARRFLAGKASAHAVPLAVLRFRDQTARLLSEAPRTVEPELVTVPVSRRALVAPRRKGRRTANQMELPLSQLRWIIIFLNLWISLTKMISTNFRSSIMNKT